MRFFKFTFLGLSYALIGWSFKLWPSTVTTFKVECVLPIVIGSKFRKGQKRDESHRGDASHFSLSIQLSIRHSIPWSWSDYTSWKTSRNVYTCSISGTSTTWNSNTTQRSYQKITSGNDYCKMFRNVLRNKILFTVLSTLPSTCSYSSEYCYTGVQRLIQ